MSSKLKRWTFVVIMVTTVVIFVQAGFALVETGFWLKGGRATTPGLPSFHVRIQAGSLKPC